jgi:hypothetical protein
MSEYTIFSHFSDPGASGLGKVHARLVELYGIDSIDLEGSPADWTKLTITRKKLLRTSTLTLNVVEDQGPRSPLKELVEKMHHVFQAVPAEKKDIQKKLLTRIKAIHLGIGLESNRRMDDWEDAIFGTAKVLDALVFWKGKQMLNAKGHIILDFDGRCRVSDLEVNVKADYLVDPPAESEEAIARKLQSEDLLKSRKIPLNPNLPVIEDSVTTSIRTVSEIADRALALCLVALKGEGLDAPILNQIAGQFEILPLLSEAEQTFMEDPAPDQQTLSNYAWRYESLAVMLWTLGYLEDLLFPDRICDVQAIVGVVREAGSRQGLRTKANLRSPKEILHVADLVFRQNWACVDARLRKEVAPAGMLSGVAYERNCAFEWIRGQSSGCYGQLPVANGQ